MAVEITENPAREWAAAIERGEMDPEDVDLERLVYDEDTHLIPELEQHLSEAQRSRFSALQEQKIDERAAENVREHGEDVSEKVATIRSAVSGRDPGTETVEFGDTELAVSTRISGRIERKIDALDDGDDLNHLRETAIDIICELIETDGWDDRNVWEAYYDEHGSEGLVAVVELLSEPALQRLERVGSSFRDERRG